MGNSPNPSPSDIARFWKYTDRRGDDDCWPWSGQTNGGGYGVLPTHCGRIRATHFSLMLLSRPRPSARHGACHTCDNPICVNPAHLWWGTQRENMQDAKAKDRLFIPPRATECVNGHALTPDNLTKIDKRGYQQCRICRCASSNAYRSRKKLSDANL